MHCILYRFEGTFGLFRVQQPRFGISLMFSATSNLKHNFTFFNDVKFQFSFGILPMFAEYMFIFGRG